MAMTLWEWAHNVQMDCLEALVRHREVSYAWINSPGLLGKLARVTGLDKTLDIGAQFGPVVV